MSDRARRAEAPVAVDPIVAEIIMQGLCAVPNLIEKNITRTAFSFLISEYKDYAAGIVDADGRLISQCRGALPIFVANALCAAVKDGLKIYSKPRLQDGDIVITNHAGTMGQHLNNVVMYTPIRLGEEDDALIGFLAIVMHWVDVGGIVVGSCQAPNTTDVFQEGIQFHTVKLYSRGERVEEIFRMIEANTRFPAMVAGDLESQIAGCMIGRDLVLEIARKFGMAEVRGAIARYWDLAERAARDAIRKLPDGIYRASSFLDDDGIHRDRPIKIEVEVRIEGDDVTVDLSGIADQVDGPLNAGYEGGAVAAARIACKYVFAPEGPANDGTFRPIHVVCPPGKFLSARSTAPIGGSGSTVPTVVDTILRALAPAARDRVPSAHHGTYCIHVFDGKLSEAGGWFQHIESSIGGWGASRHRDGTGPFRSVAHGDTMEVPIELQESAHPYRLEYVRLRPDSGGAGRHRGGLGVEKAYHILKPCQLTVNIERTKCPPWGLEGGHEGQTGRVEIHRAGSEPMVVLKGQFPLQAGDRVLLFTAGGGGYGDPRLRPRDKVLDDVREGYISMSAAVSDYGLTLTA
jgi:N-methylhydantoinase B